MTDPTWPITCTITGKPVPKPDPVCYGARGQHRLTVPKKPDYVEWRARVDRAYSAPISVAIGISS